MRRTVFNEDHEAFRQILRDFIEAEVVPHYQEWYDAGIVPREFYYKLAELGLFGIEVPEEYGGAGIKSFKYNAIETEELARAGRELRRLGRARRAVPAVPAQARHRRAEEALAARSSSAAR